MLDYQSIFLYIILMFIRTKTSPNSPKKSVQIVESIRNGANVRQKIVRHIGTALSDDELQKLKELAEYVKAKLETESQPNLFAPEEIAQMVIEAKKTKDDNPINVDLKKLREEQRIIIGIHEVYGQIYNELGFQYTLGSPKRKVSSSRNLFNIVMARIANPSSKRSSVRQLEKDFGQKLSLDGVYKMMDMLDEEKINKIQKLSYEAASGIIKERIDVIFYDCTTLYFESFTEDELKENGYSKDMKFNQPQVLLALITTSEGFPVGYEVYPGSYYEGNTLELAIEKLEKQFEVGKIIFVADSAMLSQTNLSKLEGKEKQYIVGARLKNMSVKMQNKITDLTNYKSTVDDEKMAVFTLGEKKRLIVTYSPKRAEKDRYDREKAIEKLRKKLERSSNPSSLISNYGYKKFLQIEGESKIIIDEEKLAESAKWDGLHGVVTNAEELNEKEVREQYQKLWQIEECFRISKHDLSLRPIYHWTPKRVKAHIAICFMALVCLRHLEYRVLKQYEKLSPEVIRNELLHVQCSILRDQSTQKRYAMPSMVTKHIRKIYQVVGLKIDSVPYEI